MKTNYPNAVMNQYIKIVILTLLITVLINTLIYTPRVIILSNLEYKRTFVHSVFITNLFQFHFGLIESVIINYKSTIYIVVIATKQGYYS